MFVVSHMMLISMITHRVHLYFYLYSALHLSFSFFSTVRIASASPEAMRSSSARFLVSGIQKMDIPETNVTAAHVKYRKPA